MPKTRAPRERGTLAPGDEITDADSGERYRIVSLIGQGGMGRVFKAERARDGALFAVKCNQPIDPHNTELVERMMREGDFLKALRPHPHIAPVLASGVRADGVFWILMPLLDGTSVDVLLSAVGRLPLIWVLEISGAVCSALATVHEVGIHRDIKPANVFLTRDGGIYLLDFGAGKSYTVGRLTTTGTAIGTAQYMSPEQLSDAAQIDGRSDLFSVGVLTFEMLAGEHPFDCDGPLRGNRYMIGQRILTEAPRPLEAFAPELPRFTSQIVEKLLSKTREHRGRSAEEAAEVFWTARKELRSRLGETAPIARIFDVYDQIRERERLATLDTEKAAAAPEPSGPRAKFGTVPMAVFGVPAIETTEPPAPPPVVEPALASPDAGEHSAIQRQLLAIERLSADDTPETRDVLVLALRDRENHPAVRAGAAAALGVVGDEACLEALQECAEQDSETMVRRMAEEAALSLCVRLGFPVQPLDLDARAIAPHAAGASPWAQLAPLEARPIEDAPRPGWVFVLAAVMGLTVGAGTVWLVLSLLRP